MNISNETREYLALFLPEVLANALTSYEQFSKNQVGNDTITFKDHHAACKVAVAHIELLIKLAERANLMGPEMVKPDKAAIIAQAKIEQEENKSERDDDGQD
jgi:hypothetical protein